MEINYSVLFWSAVNFLILFWLLRKFFWSPLLEMMEERREEIKGDLAEAEEAREEAEALRSDYREQLQQAREEAQKIINEASEKAEEQREAIIAQSRKEAQSLREEARKAIRREKERAFEELRAEVADLAVMATRKIIEAELDEEKHRSLVKDYVDKVGEIK